MPELDYEKFYGVKSDELEGAGQAKAETALEVAKPKRGIASDFFRGVVGGVAAPLAGAASFGANVIGMKETAKALHETVVAPVKEWSSPEQGASIVNQIANAVGGLAGMVGPTFLLPGGQIGGVTEAATVMGRLVQGLRATGVARATVPAVAMTLSNSADVYQKEFQRTKNHDEAMYAAYRTMPATLGINVATFGVMMKPGVKVLKRMYTDAALMGGTTVAQEGVNIGLGELRAPTGKEVADTGVNALKMAVAGGLFGATMHMGMSSLERAMRKGKTPTEILAENADPIEKQVAEANALDKATQKAVQQESETTKAPEAAPVAEVPTKEKPSVVVENLTGKPIPTELETVTRKLKAVTEQIRHISESSPKYEGLVQEQIKLAKRDRELRGIEEPKPIVEPTPEVISEKGIVQEAEGTPREPIFPESSKLSPLEKIANRFDNVEDFRDYIQTNASIPKEKLTTQMARNDHKAINASVDEFVERYGRTPDSLDNFYREVKGVDEPSIAPIEPLPTKQPIIPVAKAVKPPKATPVEPIIEKPKPKTVEQLRQEFEQEQIPPSPERNVPRDLRALKKAIKGRTAAEKLPDFEAGTNQPAETSGMTPIDLYRELSSRGVPHEQAKKIAETPAPLTDLKPAAKEPTDLKPAEKVGGPEVKMDIIAKAVDDNISKFINSAHDGMMRSDSTGDPKDYAKLVKYVRKTFMDATGDKKLAQRAIDELVEDGGLSSTLNAMDHESIQLLREQSLKRLKGELEARQSSASPDLAKGGGKTTVEVRESTRKTISKKEKPDIIKKVEKAQGHELSKDEEATIIGCNK